MGPREFIANEYEEYQLYTDLLNREKNESFRKVLETLISHEKRHYEFWKTQTDFRPRKISRLKKILYRTMRATLGLTFFVKFLERKEKDAIEHYKQYMKSASEEVSRNIQAIIEDERVHEQEATDNINEEKVEFTGSIILGLNDGLIELTGALVGFSFAFSNSLLVAMSGLITGISAALSMAASAYMQERHDTNGKDPIRSAMYTGSAYIIVVLLMVSPFFLPLPILGSLIITLAIVISIVALTSFYTSILFDRKFATQFAQMFTFSIGVAVIAFIIGSIFRSITGVEIA